MEEAIGKLIEREPNIVKAVCQFLEDVVEFATTGGFMRSNKLVVGPPDLFVEFDVGGAAQAAALCALVKNATDEERIISGVRAQQKCLFRRGALQRNQHVRNIFMR